MKPKFFIGSSAESIDIAYAIQENLVPYAEVTVWSQGIFELSNYTLDSLIDALEKFDFGAFVFSPDDLTIMRNQEKRAVRDNVVFELGLFLGRLGKNHCFIIIPNGNEDFHLPTDLAGVTPATFESNRQDSNLIAALGPACNKIRKILERNDPTHRSSRNDKVLLTSDGDDHVEYDENDKKAILASWMGSRTSSANIQVIQFAKVDQELKLERGSTKKYIKEIASQWDYIVDHEGDNTILFKEKPHSAVISKGICPTWLDRW